VAVTQAAQQRLDEYAALSDGQQALAAAAAGNGGPAFSHLEDLGRLAADVAVEVCCDVGGGTLKTHTLSKQPSTSPHPAADATAVAAVIACFSQHAASAHVLSTRRVAVSAMADRTVYQPLTAHNPVLSPAGEMQLPCLQIKPC
jgi:hypothetical protein